MNKWIQNIPENTECVSLEGCSDTNQCHCSWSEGRALLSASDHLTASQAPEAKQGHCIMPVINPLAITFMRSFRSWFRYVAALWSQQKCGFSNNETESKTPSRLIEKTMSGEYSENESKIRGKCLILDVFYTGWLGNYSGTSMTSFVMIQSLSVQEDNPNIL